MSTGLNKYTVILTAKHSSEVSSITLYADDAEDAMERANTLIDTDDSYTYYRTGWRISEAVEC